MTDILVDYLDEDAAAKELRRNPRTLQRWRSARIGPPVTYIGKTPYYRKQSLQDWLLTQERKPKRGKASAA